MMKPFSLITGLTAMLLVGLGACTKAPQNVNPDFDPETKTVKTQFVLNVSTNNTSTKMSAATVQEPGQKFRGMDYVHLMTYKLGYTCTHGEHFMYKVGDETSKATRDYDLGAMLSSSDITSTNSSRMVELSIPLEANCLMLYGLASKTGTDDEQGGVIPTGTGLNSTLEDLSFALKTRHQHPEAFTGMCNIISRSLTALTKAALEAATTSGRDTRYAFWWPKDETSAEFAVRDGEGGTTGNPFTPTNKPSHPGYTYYTGSLSWQQLGEDYAEIHHSTNGSSKIQTALEEKLGDAFYEFTTIKSKTEGGVTYGELRAGSAGSILRTLQDLSEILSRISATTATTPQDEVARLLAVEIQFRINQYFEGTGANLYFKPMSTILSNAEQFFPDYNTAVAPYVDYLTNPDLGNFFPPQGSLEGGWPTNLGLPLGAALLVYKDMGGGEMGFDFLDAVPAYGMGTGSLPIANYRYPPELIYWANSGIRVSNETHDSQHYPNTVSGWANDANWSSDWVKNGSVSSSTRSVALMKQVNYGTALLESTVTVGTQTIRDNKSNLFPGESDQVIDVSEMANAFKVTGIFIGGVPDFVGWDFIRKENNFPGGATSNEYDKMIYDRISPLSIRYGSPAKFYTLTWDSYRPKMNNTGQTIGVGEQSDQVDVYIGLELVNNTGRDLWGELNLIRNGGTFYLVGKLDLNKALENDNVTFPDESYFHYPPFDTNGTTIEVKRVFMQDYKTRANLLLSETSLQHAYMTMPDLRSSQISMGLTVDVSWQPGLDFSVTLGNTQ